jgi:hypothetical protein
MCFPHLFEDCLLLHGGVSGRRLLSGVPHDDETRKPAVSLESEGLLMDARGRRAETAAICTWFHRLQQLSPQTTPTTASAARALPSTPQIGV